MKKISKGSSEITGNDIVNMVNTHVYPSRMKDRGDYTFEVLSSLNREK